MKPPATKGNKKENRLGDKIEDKTSGRHTIQHQGGHLKKTLRTPNSTLFEKNAKSDHPPQRNKKKDKLGDKLGDKKEDKLGDKQGDKGYKTSGRRTPHPTQAHMWGDNGRQEDLEGGNDPRRRHHPTQAHMWGQWETIRRQDVGKADTPSDTGTHVGRQWETMADKGETTKKQTYHHRHTCGETMGDKKGPQDVEKADAPSNTGTRVWRQWETMGDNGREWETIGSMGDKGRQDLGKADIPSNTGRQGETRPREGEHTIQNMQAHMWGDNGRQKGKTRRREGGRTIQQRHTCGETMGNSG